MLCIVHFYCRWKEIQQGVWRSVLSGQIWTLKQTDTKILYQVHDTKGNIPGAVIKSEPLSEAKPGRSKGNSVKQFKEEAGVGAATPVYEIKSEEGNSCTDILTDYFQLNVSLESLYKQWQAADGNFCQVAADFPGVRILRQDPTENLFAFICSSNNNISRITSMVEKLCIHYGKKVGCIDGEDWYTFPSVVALAQDSVEQHLRDLGFGYRAKFINQTAKIISKKENGWLDRLRHVSYQEAHSELLQLTGVGAKVYLLVVLISTKIFTTIIPFKTKKTTFWKAWYAHVK